MKVCFNLINIIIRNSPKFSRVSAMCYYYKYMNMYENSLCHANFWICLTNQLMLWSFRDQLIRHLHVHVHCNCKEKCFTFSWRSRPDIGVAVNLCWINQVYKASSNSSSASFSDFRFNPSHVLMLLVNFRILSLFLHAFIRDCQIQKLNLFLFLLYLNMK